MQLIILWPNLVDTEYSSKTVEILLSTFSIWKKEITQTKSFFLI